MLPYSANIDLNISSDRMNSSILPFPHHYAPQFPYTFIDEQIFHNLLNFTMIKNETVSNESNVIRDFGADETLNYELSCNVSQDESGWFSVEFQATLHFMYITILLIAIFGNSIVCFIIWQSSRMQTVTNYFIANLAVGDMLMAIFCIPFSFVSLFVLQYWPFGWVMCKFVNYTQAISVLVSAYTLVAISIDRYIAIMFPLKPRLSKRYAKLIIFIVWCIALITASPIPIVSSLNQPSDWFKKCDRFICRETWEKNEHEQYYSLALMSLQFIIPLGVLIFTYTRIAVAVWGKRPPGEAENLRDLRMARSKRKMIKMMLAVVFVFIFSWLPFNMFMLLGPNIVPEAMIPYFWFSFHWLAMSHSCYNPLIYCYMNARFRSGFIMVLHNVPGFQKFCSKRFRGLEETSQLNRMNTSTTYISTRRKQNTVHHKTEPNCCCAETSLHR